MKYQNVCIFGKNNLQMRQSFVIFFFSMPIFVYLCSCPLLVKEENNGSGGCCGGGGGRINLSLSMMVLKNPVGEKQKKKNHLKANSGLRTYPLSQKIVHLLLFGNLSFRLLWWDLFLYPVHKILHNSLWPFIKFVTSKKWSKNDIASTANRKKHFKSLSECIENSKTAQLNKLGRPRKTKMIGCSNGVTYVLFWFLFLPYPSLSFTENFFASSLFNIQL